MKYVRNSQLQEATKYDGSAESAKAAGLVETGTGHAIKHADRPVEPVNLGWYVCTGKLYPGRDDSPFHQWQLPPEIFQANFTLIPFSYPTSTDGK